MSGCHLNPIIHAAESQEKQEEEVEVRLKDAMGKIYAAGDSWNSLALWANVLRREGPPEWQVSSCAAVHSHLAGTCLVVHASV